MGELPRLPVPLEHRVLKWACGRSPRSSRLLFGKPPTIDGQTLSPETQALLTLARWSGSNGFFAGRSVEGGPRQVGPTRPGSGEHQRPIRDGRGGRGSRIPEPNGPNPARLYVPAVPAPEAAAPLLVYYHGGGWVIGDLDMYDGSRG